MAKRRAYDRTDRVNQQLLEVISRVMLTDVRDPRVQQTQITAVEVSPDLRHARVFWVSYNEDMSQRDTQEGLENLSGWLRREVGQRIKMKHTPELEFCYDESIERGRRMEKLIAEIDTGGARDDDESKS
jgi:ribosome-binding factor A